MSEPPRSPERGSRARPGSAFARFARTGSRLLGHPAAFSLALLLILGWLLTGPLFRFNDTWQLVINTFTTIVTFLMVFLVQNSQNRDAEALQLKVDELIRAVEGASDSMMSIESLDDAELERLMKRMKALGERARRGENSVERLEETASHPG